MVLQGTWSHHSINLGGKISTTLRRSSSSAAFWLGSPVGGGGGLDKFAHEISVQRILRFINMYVIA